MKRSALASAIGARLVGADGEVRRAATLADAGPEDLSFLANPKYAEQALASLAGAVLCSPNARTNPRASRLEHNHPYLAWARALKILHPNALTLSGVDPRACVEDGATIAASAWIGPLAYVGSNAVIKDRVRVYPFAFVGADAIIGEECILHPHAVVMERSVLEEGVTLHPGSVVGSQGFGWAPDENHLPESVPQLGGVVLEKGVSLGANSTIDRGALGNTTLGERSVVDNLVQVAHNVKMGKGCTLVAQSGISGSTQLGDGVVVAGQSGVVGHVQLGDGARVGAKSAVTKNVPSGETYTGIPARPHSQWRRAQAMLLRLEGILRRLRKLERRK